MHCLPFKNRSRAIRPKENGRKHLQAHHGSQRAHGLWRTRGRGTKDDHEPHGNANNASRIDSDRSGKVLSSNCRPALGGNNAQHADNDSQEGDEHHSNSHVSSTHPTSTLYSLHRSGSSGGASVRRSNIESMNRALARAPSQRV